MTVLSAQFTGLNDLKKAVETGRKKIETMKKKAEEGTCPVHDGSFFFGRKRSKFRFKLQLNLFACFSSCSMR